MTLIIDTGDRGRFATEKPMTTNEWEQVIREAVELADSGDQNMLIVLIEHLNRCQTAKQILRDKGHGWTGLDILETARMVREA